MKLNCVLLAPDSFKGTLSAQEVCDIEAQVIRKRFPEAEILTLPMADGGEGMTESYLRLLGGTRVACQVTGPLGEKVDAAYGILPDGSAVMEMAAAAGLPLVEGREAPLLATSHGVGEMILDAVERGAKKILLGLGGSATNDCGIGMAAALGYRFLSAEGEPVIPIPQNMQKIRRILPPADLPEVEIVAACDVDNPLTGPQGATHIFGPQKGVDAETLPILEAGMRVMARLFREQLGADVETTPGAGAAGGLGAAIQAFLGGVLRPGIELLLDTARFDTLLERADLVITGEGRIDGQSAHGKVPAGVGKRCVAQNVPCIALCGSIGPGAESAYDVGLTAMFAAVSGVGSLDDIRRTCREDLASLTDSVLRLLALS